MVFNAAYLELMLCPRPGLSDILSQPVIVDYHCQNLENTAMPGAGTLEVGVPFQWGTAYCAARPPGRQDGHWLGTTPDCPVRCFRPPDPTSSTWGCPRVSCPLGHYGWQGCCSRDLLVTVPNDNICQALPLVFAGAMDRLPWPPPGTSYQSQCFTWLSLLALISMLFFLQWLWP